MATANQSVATMATKDLYALNAEICSDLREGLN